MVSTNPSPLGVSTKLNRRDHDDVGGDVAVGVQVDRFATIFKFANKVWILLGASLDFFPGEQLVVAGRDVVEREMSVLIRGRREVQVGTQAPRLVWNQCGDGAGKGIGLGVINDTLKAACSESDFAKCPNVDSISCKLDL